MLILIIGLLSTVVYLYSMKASVSIKPENELLLIPLRITDHADTPYGGNPAGIYVISPNEKSKYKLFFADLKVRSFDFPLVQDKKFFCVGYDSIAQKDVSKLYLVDPILPENNRGEIIMQVYGRISYPVPTKDIKAVYYIKENKLFRWKRDEQKEEIISESSVSGRFLLDHDERIYCSIDGSLVKLLPDGTTELLLENVGNITWYEKDKIILYASYVINDGKFQFGIYQLDNKKNTILGTLDRRTLALSNDKKYLARKGDVILYNLSAPDTIYLTTIDMKESQELSYSRRMRKSIKDNICWINKSDIQQ